MQVGEGFLKPIQESSWWKQAYCNEYKHVSMLLSQGKATFGDKQAFYVKLRVPFGHKQSFWWKQVSLCAF